MVPSVGFIDLAVYTILGELLPLFHYLALNFGGMFSVVRWYRPRVHLHSNVPHSVKSVHSRYVLLHVPRRTQSAPIIGSGPLSVCRRGSLSGSVGWFSSGATVTRYIDTVLGTPSSSMVTVCIATDNSRYVPSVLPRSFYRTSSVTLSARVLVSFGGL